MKSLFIIILSLSIVGITVNASHSAQYWAKTYGWGEYDWAYSSKQTTDRGYIVAGTTYFHSSPGNRDFWVLKLYSDGNVSWEKTYGLSEEDTVQSIQQTKDGGYILAGSFFVPASDIYGAYDILVLKLGINGDITWQKTYGGIDCDDFGDSIQQTTDGGYIVAGRSSCSATDIGFYLMKLDSNGDVTWQKKYGSFGVIYNARTIQQTTDGGYIVAGYTASYGNFAARFLVLKLDCNGDVTWQKTYGGSSYDYAYSIQQTIDGGYILAGDTHSFGDFDPCFWVLKLDCNGDVTWQKTYGGIIGSSNFAKSIRQTSDGGYIVCGDTNSFCASHLSDAWVLKLQSDGDIIWQKYYGGVSSDSAHSIEQTSDGGYIVAGVTYSFGADESNFWILKLDRNGEIPYCDIIGISNAIISDTSILGRDSNATVQSTSATVTETNITSQDTSKDCM